MCEGKEGCASARAKQGARGQGQKEEGTGAGEEWIARARAKRRGSREHEEER